MTAPERIWIQRDHILGECDLNRWDIRPDDDEAHLFQGYWSDSAHEAAVRETAAQVWDAVASLARQGATAKLMGETAERAAEALRGEGR